MSTIVESSVTSKLKPRNIFYVWYTELCRRCNTSPLAVVKPAKLKSDVILNFVADRIKCEEWSPILQALSLDTSLHVISIKSRLNKPRFHYDINTEEKACKIKNPSPVIFTDFILKALTSSLGSCIRNSDVLSKIELDGILIPLQYLEILVQNLKYNRSIKELSFKGSQINDGGCQMICTSLRLMPNIAVVNMSLCNLTALSGQYISKIIRHQQINRYSQSWHNSLRYEEPDSGTIGGLKRLTLNNNPNIGDDGLLPILDVLDDDLWIKAIDMQNCNITENMSKRIMNLVEQNSCLEVADFRNNERLTTNSLEKIFDAFDRKYRIGNNPEYCWEETTTSICDKSFSSVRSSTYRVNQSIHKVKSATIRNLETIRLSSTKEHLRRTRTNSMLNHHQNSSLASLSNHQLSIAKKELSELHSQLLIEKNKRREVEKINKELQKQLENMRRLEHLYHDYFLAPEKITKAIQITNHLNQNQSEQTKCSTKDVVRKTSAIKNVLNNNKKAIDTRNVRLPSLLKIDHSPAIKMKSTVSKEKIGTTLQTTLRRKSKHKKKLKVMSPIYELSSRQENPDKPATAVQILFTQLLMESNHKHCIEENNGNDDAVLQYCWETDDLSKDGPSLEDLSHQKESFASVSDSSLDLLYRQLDNVDLDTHLQS